MQQYLSVGGECRTQKIIEKSRFITTSLRVCGEDEAKAFIARITAEFPDATHNCYAYICDNLGNFLRFSDAGEPQGTAGMPMLEVLKSKKLYETAVVVTRYFGGIKLGAGGLLRAYSGCAAENLDAAQKVLFQQCVENKYIVDYSSVDTATRFFSERKCELLSTEYLNEVVFTAAIKKSEEEDFNARFLNRLNGRVKIQKVKEYFYPFKI